MSPNAYRWEYELVESFWRSLAVAGSGEDAPAPCPRGPHLGLHCRGAREPRQHENLLSRSLVTLKKRRETNSRYIFKTVTYLYHS